MQYKVRRKCIELSKKDQLVTHQQKEEECDCSLGEEDYSK